MIVESPAGEFCETAVVVVSIESVDRRAVSNPVFHDRRDTSAREVCGAALKSLRIRSHQCADALGRFAEGAGDARPARFGADVGLR